MRRDHENLTKTCSFKRYRDAIASFLQLFTKFLPQYVANNGSNPHANDATHVCEDMGMIDEELTLETSLLDLPQQEWLSAVEDIAGDDGYVVSLGKRHHAVFVEKGTTLLVTFETLQGIQALSDLGQPLGWDMLKSDEWSNLCICLLYTSPSPRD